jgi:hypothetical protein
MKRVTTGQLLELGAELGARECEAIQTLGRLRLMTHAQLSAIIADDAGSPASAARSARRILARLTDSGVLTRLDRRIGGVRRGSAGYVYYLGPVGQRLVAYWQGRGLTRGRFRPDPGGRYVRHRLAVSELYIETYRAGHDGVLEPLAFDAEPECWRSYVNGFGGQGLLKPDAFLRIGVGAYEDRYFVEVDLGSESRTVIARKVRTYLDYFNTGQEQQSQGVFPRVLLLTNTQARRDALVEVCVQLPAEAWRLFTVTTLDRAVEVLSGQLDGQAGAPAFALEAP